MSSATEAKKAITDRAVANIVARLNDGDTLKQHEWSLIQQHYEVEADETPARVNLGTYATLTEIARATVTGKDDASRILKEGGIVAERGKGKGAPHFYPLLAALRQICEVKNAGASGKTAMDAKLEQDMLYTQQKRLRDAGELIDRTEAERVISQVAAITSNVVDAWGLDRKRRNELMERIEEGVRRAWKGEDDDDEEGDE